MEETKNYTVEFIYTDNNQIFQTGADLTPDEVRDMKRVLGQYEAAGAIEQPQVFESIDVKQNFWGALGEVIDALEDKFDSDSMSKCQNCGTEWPGVLLITPIPDLDQRVAPGEVFPSGECPACGAVCHLMAN